MKHRLRETYRWLTRSSRSRAVKTVKVVIGFTLLLVGVIMMVTPGPAVVVIPLALSILAGEFLWARRLLKRFQDGVTSMTAYVWPEEKKTASGGDSEDGSDT